MLSQKPFSTRFWFWHKVVTRNVKLREGQALMLALENTDVELYDLIHGSAADCFYDDKLIPKFNAEIFGTITND